MKESASKNVRGSVRENLRENVRENVRKREKDNARRSVRESSRGSVLCLATAPYYSGITVAVHQQDHHLRLLQIPHKNPGTPQVLKKVMGRPT